MSSSSSTESPKAGDDVSEPINEEELGNYQYASNVNVSNFVSVKLLDKSNYTLWKKQMLCLLDSQNLRGCVDSKYELPEVKSSNIMKQYNSLVEGWIYGSLNEYMLKLLVYIEGPRCIWLALEMICDPQEAATGSGSSSTELPKGGDVSDQPINEEELRYRYASNVKVSNFVSVKLLDKSNYTHWKAQMLYFLDSQNMCGLVDAGFKLLEVKSSTIMEQYKSLVKGWIYGSLNEDMLKRVMNSGGPQEIWSALETICDPQEAPAGSGSSSTESPKAVDHVSAEPINEEELRYLYASNVNVSNFVSVRLLTKNNYTTWKKQMLCLLDSENLRGFVDATVDLPEIKSPNIKTQYERLVKGWILRSLNEDMHRKVRWYYYPRSLWKRLESICDPKEDSTEDDEVLKKRVHDVLFSEQGEVNTTVTVTPPPQDNTITETPPPPDNTKTETPPPPANTSRNDKLVKAVVDGRWLEAKVILKNNKDAATEAIRTDGDTMLHIAVIEGRNNFLERLLDFIDDESKIKVTDGIHQTALHVAAIWNNKCAAQLLVNKCKSLLFCVDYLNRIPLEIAYDCDNLDTFLYLWEAVNDELGKPEDINRTQVRIRETINFDILEDAISTKQYDIASRLVNTFPQVAMQDGRLLMAMARTFPTDLGFGEAFICPSLNNFHQRILNRSSALFNALRVLYAWADDVLWATRSFKEAMWLLQETVLILHVPVAVLYPLYQLICLLILVILYPFFMVYFLLWTVLAIAVMPIKRIEKKRKKYEEAKEFVNIICNHIDKLGSFGKYEHPCYSKPVLEAVCQGAFEVVDEILSRSPDLIELENKEDYEFIQLAITNRSDKIYNLIYYLNLKMGGYRNLLDSSGNNILHLAGRLAPERILSRTTGAALQLQRELQWFQEVEKLMLPGDLLKKNNAMETPHMVFTREHANLVKEGEQWMKTTSEACSITAALIVTIVFAAAITVPGGNNQETGIPLFKKQIAFTIFAVCDAVSLFSAASALLVFLSILTTRFAEKDFLVSLPRRLIIGLCALFLSTASMMAAFSTILFLVFCDQRPWMLAPIGGLTCMPIAVIVTLQLPLLVDLFKSTYIPIFGKQKYIATGKFISNHPILEYEP